MGINMHTKKITDILMLVMWIIQLIFGIVCVANGKEISAGVFICAVIICILHYAGELLTEN